MARSTVYARKFPQGWRWRIHTHTVKQARPDGTIKRIPKYEWSPKGVFYRTKTEAQRAGEPRQNELREAGGYVAWEAAQEAACKAEEEARANTTTVADALDLWYQAGKAVWKPRSADTHLSRVRRIKLVLGKTAELPVDQLTPSHVIKFYAALGDKAPATRVRYKNTLCPALDLAVQTGRLASNPCDRVPKRLRPTEPRRDGREHVVLRSKEEAQKLLDTVQHDAPEILGPVALALFAGLRNGETLGLKWSDIEEGEPPLLWVRRVVTRSHGTKPHFADPKSATSKRHIPVGRPLAEALKVWRQRQAEERLAAGSLWEDNDLVVPGRLGGIGSVNELSAAWRKFRKAHPEVIPVHPETGALMKFHDLRHTFGTLLDVEGASLSDIQDLMGHSTPAVTKAFYVNTRHERDKARRSLIDRAFGGQEAEEPDDDAEIEEVTRDTLAR